MIFALVFLTFAISIIVNYLLSRGLVKKQARVVAGEGLNATVAQKSSQIAGLSFLDDILYYQGHTWVDLKNATVSVGADDFASKFVGKIDRIETLPVGVEVKRGQPIWRIFFGDRWIVQRAPVSGRVAVVNQRVVKSPHVLSESPYGDKWIVKIVPESLMVEAEKLFKREGFMRIADRAISKFLSQLKPALGELYTDSGALIKGAARQIEDEKWEEISTELFSGDLDGD
ncbi:MAG TPA: glycine cleavage system protein H [Thermodesulfobacteriota bacterium]|nr:glycine cleavage system protein H [Thermodesulfobacteriota bacterium]